MTVRIQAGLVSAALIILAKWLFNLSSVLNAFPLQALPEGYKESVPAKAWALKFTAQGSRRKDPGQRMTDSFSQFPLLDSQIR